MSLLRAYRSIRALLEGVARQSMPRRVTGELLLNPTNLTHLQNLHDAGYVEAENPENGTSVELHLDAEEWNGKRVRIVLKPGNLPYFEDLDELLATTAEEPPEYSVHGIGDVRRDQKASVKIEEYRDCLAARDFLKTIAEFSDNQRAIFFTPKKLEIRFQWSAGWIRALPDLSGLRADFATEKADSEERLILFKRTLREYLHSQAIPDRFSLFIRNFDEILDSYRKDYDLWLNNAFSEIKKEFEERRLKFVEELGNILNGIQASILAVPLAAAVIGDKFDLANPRQNFFLAVAVFFVAFIALKLLHNQSHTLIATESAISAVKTDYGTRHRDGSIEFDARMSAIEKQAKHVRKLLGYFLLGNFLICAAVTIFWLVSYYHWRWPTEPWSPLVLTAATLIFFYLMRRWWMATKQDH